MFRRGWRVPFCSCSRRQRSCCRSLLPAQSPVPRHPRHRRRYGATPTSNGPALVPGQKVNGFIADTATPSTRHAPYPPSNPTSGFTATERGFAGIIHGQPTDGSAALSLYCIDIRTNTYPGFGYGLGTWDAANVPNVGYVARLLNEYYPNNQRTRRADQSDQKAAAVQAAIWFFSDRYVLSTSDSAARRRGAHRGPRSNARGRWSSRHRPASPSPRRLVSGPAGHRGRTVHGHPTGDRRLGSGPSIAVTATGATMFSDAAGTNQIGDGTTVLDPGQTSGCAPLVRPAPCSRRPRRPPSPAATSTSTTATRPATASPEAHPGRECDVDHHGPGHRRVPAPRLVGREEDDRRSRCRNAGRVVIHVACDDGVARDDFIIPAGTPAGDSVAALR